MISGIKTGNVGRSFQGFGELSVTFAMAPRTIGGILKEGAEEGLSYVSGLPITNPFSAKRVSNQDIVQRAADFADRKRIRQGFKVDSVGGTKAHGYSNDVINRYQRRFGNVGLDVENVSYKNGLAARYGEKGSIRFDVIDTTNGASYDFKFGAEKNWPALKPTRVDQLLRHGPAWVRSVTEINPVRR